MLVNLFLTEYDFIFCHLAFRRNSSVRVQASPCVRDQAGWLPFDYAEYMLRVANSGHTEKVYEGHEEVLRVLRDSGGSPDHCSRL